ncbi:MAG: hypothetical protein GXX90_11035, partial [Microbacteriaceae bacterium]|nr:hypothetical protein [Microbacteriaceae bacterium]
APAPHAPGAGAPAAPVATPFAAPAPPMPALPIPPSPCRPRGPLPPPAAPPAASAPPTPPTPPRRRFTPQSLLLITGVAFLSIAAAVFLTVAFVLFDLVTKAIIVAGVTTAVVVGASLLRRTRLVSTAEGIGALGVVLLGLDAWAIRALDFFGLAAPPTAPYWGVALLVLGALLHLWGRVSRLRAPLLASAVALPVGVAALVGALLSDVLELRGTFLVAAATAVASSALAPVLHRREGRVDRLEAALMLGAGQAVAAAGLLSAIGAAFGEPLAPTAIGAGMLVAGLAAQLAVLVRRDELHSLPALRGSAAVLGVGAWTVAVLVGGQALLAPEIPGVALAPLAALAIPAADLARGRPLLRGAGTAGAITALLAVLPQFAVGLGLPLLGLWAVRQLGRANSPATSEGSGALLLTGALLLAVGIAAALAYRRFGDAAAHRHRGALAGGAAAVGLVIAAVALPVPGTPIALAALAVLAAAGAIALRGRATPLADALRGPVGLVHLLAAAAILGAVPFGTAGWAGAALLGLGTIAARLAAARGRRSVGLSIALVVAALLVLVALELARGFDAWSAPAALLAVLVPLGLVALRGAARPHPVDRGVLVAATTTAALLLALLRWSAPAPGLPLAPGLVLAAGALVAIAVALLPLVELPTAPRPGSSQR